MAAEAAGNAGRGLGWASLGRGRSAGTGSGAAGVTAAGKKFSRLSLGCFGVVGVSPEACEGEREVRQAGWAARARTVPHSAPLWPRCRPLTGSPRGPCRDPASLSGRTPWLWRGLRGSSWARAGVSEVGAAVTGPVLGATSQRRLKRLKDLEGHSRAPACPRPASRDCPQPGYRPSVLHPLGGAGTAQLRRRGQHKGPGALSPSEQRRGPTALSGGTPVEAVSSGEPPAGGGTSSGQCPRTCLS